MLIVAKRVLGRNFAFATVRGKSKKQQTKLEDEYDMEKDVFKAYRKQVEKGSILRQFREEVFRKSELRGDWELQETKQKREVQGLEKMLNVDKESVLSNATQIQAKAIRQRNIFDQNTGRSLLSEYANYKPYDKVHPVIKDRNLIQGEFLEDSHITQNLYKFIDKLSDDYAEKEELRQIVNTLPANKQGMSLTEYGKVLQKKINDAQRSAAKKYQDFKLHDEQKFTSSQRPLSQRTDIERNWFNRKSANYEYTGIQKTVDPYTGGENIQATLSPKAVDTIYELYLQGWNVRDISKRFGILPARTKFCVWVRAQLYHEVIPKLGVKYYLRGLRFQQKFNQYQSFCDYGLDLDQLSNNSILQQITEWNGNMLDAQREQQKYQGAMMRLEKENKFNKYQMVQVGTIGKQNARYKLKQWVIFKGKGSDQYFLKNKLLNPLTRAQKKFNKVYY